MIPVTTMGTQRHAEGRGNGSHQIHQVHLKASVGQAEGDARQVSEH